MRIPQKPSNIVRQEGIFFDVEKNECESGKTRSSGINTRRQNGTLSDMNNSQWGDTSRRFERRDRFGDVVEDSRTIGIDFSRGIDFAILDGGIGSQPRLSDVAEEKWGISSEMEMREGGCGERFRGHLPKRTTVNDALCQWGENRRVESYEIMPRPRTLYQPDRFPNMPPHFQCSAFNSSNFSRLDNPHPMGSDMQRPSYWWPSHIRPHEEINWTRPPPMDSAQFHSYLGGENRHLHDLIVEVLKEDRQVSIINLSQSALGEGRPLGAVAEILPELAGTYEKMAKHQMKTVAMIDRGVEFKTPRRGAGIRIKAEGKRCRDPHLAFATVDEAEKFGVYGVATLAFVVQEHLHGPRDKLLRDLARAIETGRIEKLIVLTHEIPPLDGIDPCSLFGNKTTVKYWQTA